VPVQRRALAFLRREVPGFLQQLRDEQPNGEVQYRFWLRGGGYDRNITDTTALRSMIEYIHRNPVRRGLVARATDWAWSRPACFRGPCKSGLTSRASDGPRKHGTRRRIALELYQVYHMCPQPASATLGSRKHAFVD
jgi:hypothetical protein